jgi:hypothetical protein
MAGIRRRQPEVGPLQRIPYTIAIQKTQQRYRGCPCSSYAADINIDLT